MVFYCFTFSYITSRVFFFFFLSDWDSNYISEVTQKKSYQKVKVENCSNNLAKAWLKPSIVDKRNGNKTKVERSFYSPAGSHFSQSEEGNDLII